MPCSNQSDWSSSIEALSHNSTALVSVIDIGTNSVLMLIAGTDPEGKMVSLKQLIEQTRLGKNLKSTRRIGDEELKATIGTVNRFRAVSAQYKANRVILAGTHVFRAAENGSEASARIFEATGLAPEILTGEEEAVYSFQGALYGRSFDEAVVIDIGGGSTELTLGKQDGIREWVSLPVGAVTGTEAFLHGDPPDRKDCMKFQEEVAGLIPVQWKKVLAGSPSILCTGGTATTLAAMILGLEEYDAGRVDGMPLSAEQVLTCLERLCSVPLENRRKILKFDPKRADIIIGGVLILLALTGPSKSSVRVSDRGLRHGIALREFGMIPSIPSRTGRKRLT